MFPISPAAARRRSCLLATTFLVPALLAVSAAKAQQLAQALPPIEITSPDENRTRAKPRIDQDQGSLRVVPSTARTSRPNAAPSGGAATGTTARTAMGRARAFHPSDRACRRND